MSVKSILKALITNIVIFGIPIIIAGITTYLTLTPSSPFYIQPSILIKMSPLFIIPILTLPFVFVFYIGCLTLQASKEGNVNWFSIGMFLIANFIGGVVYFFIPIPLISYILIFFISLIALFARKRYYDSQTPDNLIKKELERERKAEEKSKKKLKS